MNTIITALESGLEYAREALARHDAELGRNHAHTKREAESIEQDIAEIEKAIEKLKGNRLNPPETAPKDGRPFLGDFGWPCLLMAIWNESDEQFCVCYPQTCELANGTIDNYFEVEWENAKDLKGWLPLPGKEGK